MSRNPYYAPEFKVLIDRKEVPETLRASISSVQHQMGMEGADRVDLTVNNENLRWLDEPLLEMGRTLELRLGYAPDPPVTMFVGEIVSAEATFPSSGLPALNVAAQDRRWQLGRGTKNRWFATPAGATHLPRDEQETVRRVAAENGLSTRFDPSGSAVQVIGRVLKTALAAQSVLTDPSASQRAVDAQFNASDSDLLRRLARESGYDLFVEHSGAQAGSVLVFFSPLEHLTSEVTLRYGASLVEFTPRVSDVGQVDSVTANVWVSGVKQGVAITVGWDGRRGGLRLSVDRGGARPGDAPAQHMIIDEPLTLATAPRRLFGELMDRLNQRMTGSGTAVGDPRIRTGAVLRIEGVGRRFGGFYRVTSARHRLDQGGYQSSFEARKEVWFEKIPDASQGAVPVVVERMIRA